MNRLTRILFAVLLAVGCGSSTGPVLTVTTSGTGKADGKTATVIEVSVTRDGKRLDRGSFTATSSLEGSSWGVIDASSTPDPSALKTPGDLTTGPATLRLYSIVKGEAVVTINYKDDVSNKTDTKTVTILFGGNGPGPGVASFDFVSAEPETIPFGESSVITFKAKDAQGAALSKAQVSFRLSQDPGGASLSPTTSETGTDGTVTTTLTAGNTAGTVIVEAFVGEVKKPTPALNISGGGINAKNLSLVCPHYSIAGFDRFGLSMDCTVFGGDYNRAYVPNSQVLFLSEAGGVPRSKDFDADPDRGGHAVFQYRTECSYPKDVTPNTGEDSSACTFFNECLASPKDEMRTCNPRDGLATLVAITTGEESYQDTNGNNTWDPGEKYIDLPEPFVDANDNGLRDSDEDFQDANNNGKWDAPNGKWDRNTAIWTSTKITWTGKHPNADPTKLKGLEVLRITPPEGEIFEHGDKVVYRLDIVDLNGNPLTSAGEQVSLSASCMDNCQVVRVKTDYSDDKGDGFGEVEIKDAHPQDCPECKPEGFTLVITLERALVANPTNTSDTEKREYATGGTFK